MRIHPFLAYVYESIDEHSEWATDYCDILEKSKELQLFSREKKMAMRLAETTLRLVTVTEQLRVVLERLQEIENLATVVPSEMLASQLHGIFDDAEFARRFREPATSEDQRIEQLPK